MAHVTEKIFFRALCNTIVFQINNFIIFLKNYSKTGADDQLRTGLLSIGWPGAWLRAAADYQFSILPGIRTPIRSSENAHMLSMSVIHTHGL